MKHSGFGPARAAVSRSPRSRAATSLGAARGISYLLGRIEIDHDGASIPSGIDVQRSPRYRLRGMHPNGWAANHPYAFRCWSEADWRRYVDMLFHLGANHLLLWPSPDIIPVPLSRADEEYLAEVRRVVAYAREVRGMEVWIMQSANRIALSDAGVADPRRRPYWLPGVQVDLDPGDPDAARRHPARPRAALPDRRQRGRVRAHRQRPGRMERQPGRRVPRPAAAARARWSIGCTRAVRRRSW